MTRADLVNKVHEALEGKLTKVHADKIVDIIFDSISGEFVAGNDVSIAKFGNFKVRVRAARDARNPRTGETVHVGEKKTVIFKPALKVKSSLNVEAPKKKEEAKKATAGKPAAKKSVKK